MARTAARPFPAQSPAPYLLFRSPPRRRLTANRIYTVPPYDMASASVLQQVVEDATQPLRIKQHLGPTERRDSRINVTRFQRRLRSAFPPAPGRQSRRSPWAAAPIVGRPLGELENLAHQVADTVNLVANGGYGLLACLGCRAAAAPPFRRSDRYCSAGSSNRAQWSGQSGPRSQGAPPAAPHGDNDG